MSGNELDLRVLKAITHSQKCALSFAEECDAKLFANEVWTTANMVVNYIRSFKGVPTLRILTDRLSKGSNDKLVETIKKTWEQIEQSSYDEREFKHDVEKLKQRYAEKQIGLVKDNLSKLDSTNLDVSRIVSDLQKTVQTIHTLNNPKSYDRRTLKEALPTFAEHFNAKRKNPKIDEGLKVGYTFFDYSTNGVKAADFVLIAGESGFGKSMLLNNMGVQAWLQKNTIDSQSYVPGKNIIYFSLEMPYEDCFNRLLSRLSGVPARHIENAEIDHEEYGRLKKAMDFIKHYPNHFEIVDIADASADNLELILSETTFPVDAIFIDYLGIMMPNKSSDDADWLKQGTIAKEVRAIARKYRLPIFSAVQLNRKSSATKDPSENIGLSRLARSASIATHATTVIQIENRPFEEQHPDFICHIIKQRKGMKGKFSLLKNFACATLLDNSEDNPTTFETYQPSQDISKQAEALDL